MFYLLYTNDFLNLFTFENKPFYLVETDYETGRTLEELWRFKTETTGRHAICLDEEIEPRESNVVADSCSWDITGALANSHV